MIQTLEPPYQHLQIYCDTNSERTKRINACSKEPETVLWLETMQPGEIFFDVGSCVGTYALLAASRRLRVWAFEPASFNLERIKQNAELNNLEIEIVPCCVGDRTGRCSMQWSNTEVGSASHKMVPGIDIRMLALDDIPVVPDHVKVDVDGSELRVVKGGRAVWEQVKSVQIEIDDSLPDYGQVIKILEDAGLVIAAWTRHGTTSISNVLFRRSPGRAGLIA